MLARAEQLKVLLAHLQAHHLSLLAAVLQLLHQQEVQEFDQPHTNSINSPSLRSSTPAGLLLYQQQHHYQQQQQQHGSAPGLIDQQHSDAGSAALGQQQLSKQVPAQVLVMAGFDPPVASVSGGVRPEAAAEQQEQEEDEFFMPVGVESALGVEASTAACCMLVLGCGCCPTVCDAQHVCCWHRQA